MLTALEEVKNLDKSTLCAFSFIIDIQQFGSKHTHIEPKKSFLILLSAIRRIIKISIATQQGSSKQKPGA
jgi:hypothetical protein